MHDDTNAQKPWIYAILIFGLIECLLLVLVFFEPAPMNAAGIAHPDVAAMRIGGDSARFAPVSDYAWWFQIVVLAQAHCLAALGVKPERRTGTFLALLSACYVIAVAVWWQMIASYENYVVSGETEFFLGFPTATAWQTYGQFFSGACLIALYSFGFRHYVWSDDDEAQFTDLVQTTTLSQASSNNQDEEA